MISGKNKELYYTSSIDKQLNIEVVGTKSDSAGMIQTSARIRHSMTL